MHYFIFKGNNLYCENFKVKSLAEKIGTPLYIYSAKTVLGHFIKLQKAFKSIDPLICYSVKANSNLSLLKILIAKGAGLDIVSAGELFRAQKVKCPAAKIVYASVGKTDREIIQAIKYGILMLNVESLPELLRIEQIAKKLSKKVDVSLRFNPDSNPQTHKYITTGSKENKFGLDYRAIQDIFAKILSFPDLNLCGLHMHIGSQITQSRPFIRAIRKAKSLMRSLGSLASRLKYLNIGGGLGIVYDKEEPQTAEEFAAKVLPLLKDLNLKIILEPGRFIVGSAGILVAKVLYVKDTPQKRFIITDAAMNDFIRPALYGAYHQIVPVERSTEAEKQRGKETKKLADVVGPVCESADFLGQDRELDIREGEFLAVMGAGAYGFSMSSNYNSRPRAAEVLVKDNKAYLVRKREDYSDLIRGEHII